MIPLSAILVQGCIKPQVLFCLKHFSALRSVSGTRPRGRAARLCEWSAMSQIQCWFSFFRIILHQMMAFNFCYVSYIIKWRYSYYFLISKQRLSLAHSSMAALAGSSGWDHALHFATSTTREELYCEWRIPNVKLGALGFERVTWKYIEKNISPYTKMRKFCLFA